MDGYQKADIKYNKLINRFIENGYKIMNKDDSDTVMELL
jgi:hypothetical protein